jgi:general secretion pathway protein E
MLDSNNIVQSADLKSIYFLHRDAALTNEGVIYTCDFESPAIEKIFALIKNHPETLPEHHAAVSVKKIERTVVNLIIDQISRTNNDPVTIIDTDKLNETAKRAVNILQDAVLRGVSDIHIELYAHETRIEGRIDGRMQSLQPFIPEHEYGKLLFGYLFNELAVDKDSDFYQSKINNGRIEIELNTNSGRRDTEWRIAYLPAKDNGGQVTLRWTNEKESITPIDEIGWEKGHVSIVRNFAYSASGICLLAGQTGSGKSSSIIGILNELKGKGRAMNTLEDPVESDLGVIQSSVVNQNDDEDLMFTYAKALLRHDADIEFHGEVRDTRGAMNVCRKGETGQIMFSTLHTSSALGIAHTLNEQMHVPSALIAAPNLMKLWIYQTLVRTLCPHCCISFNEAQAHLNDEQRQKVTRWLSDNGGSNMKASMRFKNPDGCEHCNEGEKGRTALVEMIVLDDEDRLFITNKDYIGWSKALLAKGFKPISSHATLKIKRGHLDIFTANERVNGLLSKTSVDEYEQLRWEEIEQDVELTQSLPATNKRSRRRGKK